MAILVVCHSGLWSSYPGSDQQSGHAAELPVVPGELWNLQHPGLPGSWPLLVGCHYVNCLIDATGEALWVYAQLKVQLLEKS